MKREKKRERGEEFLKCPKIPSTMLAVLEVKSEAKILKGEANSNHTFVIFKIRPQVCKLL